jgi:hypothetical protein
MKESESSESEKKIEESDSEVLCTDCTALVGRRCSDNCHAFGCESLQVSDINSGPSCLRL